MKKELFLKISFLIFCFGMANNVFAIGMVTEPIIVDNILRGGEIIKTVTVLNPEKENALFSFGTDGAIKGWVTFFETNDLKKEIIQTTVPAGSYYDVIAKIKVPEGTPNGQYIGSIFVKQEPKSENKEENTVSIAQSVSRVVRLMVTDKEVIDLTTTLIPEKYDLAKGESLKIRIIYNNQGNISLKPGLQMRIIDISTEKAVFNAIFPYPEEEEAVVPGEKKELPVFEWQTVGQSEGRYKAEINTLINNEATEANSFHFNIGNVPLSNDLLGSNFLAAVSMLGGNNLILGWFVLGGILLIIAGTLTFFYKKRPELLKVGVNKIKSFFSND